MRELKFTLTTLIGIWFTGFGLFAAAQVEELQKDLSGLPEIVLAAVEGSKEDIAITGFRHETEMGQVVYEVVGYVDDICFEVDVTENGQVLEIDHCD